MQKRRLKLARGFTLLELMVTMGVVGVLAAIAIPNMRTFLQNNRLASAANDLLRSIQIARTEAIKRQTGSVAVCATADSTVADAALSCNYGNFGSWFVFVDANNNAQHEANEVVLNRGAASTTDTVKSDRNGILCFSQTGFASVTCNGKTLTQNIVMCDQRGNVAVGNDSSARALFITQTGRARVSQKFADVATAMANVPGNSCP